MLFCPLFYWWHTLPLLQGNLVFFKACCCWAAWSHRTFVQPFLAPCCSSLWKHIATWTWELKAKPYQSPGIQGFWFPVDTLKDEWLRCLSLKELSLALMDRSPRTCQRYGAPLSQGIGDQLFWNSTTSLMSYQWCRQWHRESQATS